MHSAGIEKSEEMKKFLWYVFMATQVKAEAHIVIGIIILLQ